MPKIAEIREIDGDIWVRVGKAGEFPSGIALWTPEEQEKYRQEAYNSGEEDGYEKGYDSGIDRGMELGKED